MGLRGSQFHKLALFVFVIFVTTAPGVCRGSSGTAAFAHLQRTVVDLTNGKLLADIPVQALKGEAEL